MAKIIDNYILIEAIRQGTYGEKHKGQNLISKEAVAVKLLEHNKNDKDDKICKQNLSKGLQLIIYRKKVSQMNKKADKSWQMYFKDLILQTMKKLIHRNVNPTNLFFNDGTIKIKNFFCCKQSASQKLFDLENYIYTAPEFYLGLNNLNLRINVTYYHQNWRFTKCFLEYCHFLKILHKINQQNYIVLKILILFLEIYLKMQLTFQTECSKLINKEQLNKNNYLMKIQYSYRFTFALPITLGLVSSINKKFSSNYQIISQIQQFETVGQQNFYISQQSIQNQIQEKQQQICFNIPPSFIFHMNSKFQTLSF